MNSAFTVSYKPSQRLHPLSVLAQLTSRRATGCLQVTSGATSWLIYLEQGRLTFASSSTNPFERLDRHLRQLSRQVPALVSAVRVQVRLLFETPVEEQTILSADYRAVCWLVDQQYLTREQASTLIEELAKEVLESFLIVTEGSYEMIERDRLNDFPTLCHLELRPLVEHCQNQLRRRQVSGRMLSSPSQPTPDPAQTTAQRAREQPQSLVPPVTPTAGAAAGGSNLELPKSASKSHYTIACIDDSPTVLQAIKSFLDDTTFSVVMINDPIKALIQVVRSKPDLVLLDVGMPNLDGYELCSLMRRHSNFKNTPIIMVTGHTGFIDRAKAKLAGASGYLTKPFTQPDLLKMVFKFLT